MPLTAARPLPLAPLGAGAEADEDLPPFRVPASHFLVALGWLSVGSVGLVLMSPSLARGAWLSPGVAATVHAFTLGWLVTSAYGALYQLAPVVLGVQPGTCGWRRWCSCFTRSVPGCWWLGLGLWDPPCIAAGWALVAAALGVWSWNLGGVFRRSARSPLIGAHVTAAYTTLWLTLGLAGVRIGNALGGGWCRANRSSRRTCSSPRSASAACS